VVTGDAEGDLLQIVSLVLTRLRRAPHNRHPNSPRRSTTWRASSRAAATPSLRGRAAPP